VHRGLSKGESWLVSTLRAWVRKSTEHLLEWSLTASGWFFKSSRFFSSSAISCWKPPMRPANGISETAFRRGGRLISWFEWLHIVAQRKGHCKHGLKYWIHGIALCWVVVIHARTPMLLVIVLRLMRTRCFRFSPYAKSCTRQAVYSPTLLADVAHATEPRAFKYAYSYDICTMLVQNLIQPQIIALFFHQLACRPC
jgi:hypothetical protein